MLRCVRERAARDRGTFRTNLKEIAMNVQRFENLKLGRLVTVLMATLFAAALAVADPQGRSVFVLTSTNNPSGNAVEVFKLDTSGPASLSLLNTLNTGGNGGASTNAGILQFQDDFGAVANFGSNTVNQLVRYSDFIGLGRTINLAGDCVKPDSLALSERHLFVVGSNCAETHDWPSGHLDEGVVKLSDPSAAQIVVGKTWAAVTLASGSVLQLPLTEENGSLSGTSTTITLPSNANNTPLGEAFWGNLLGFTPAHSPDSFALIDENRNVSPIVGPAPPYPTNAPCWVAKGPRSVWYTGNSPGDAISIFFTDGQGGAFYKSIPLPGSPTDITVSADKKWLAVIYSASGPAYVAVYSIDSYGDLTWVARSPSVGVAAFSGVAISE
jgi:hypothetical protein